MAEYVVKVDSDGTIDLPSDVRRIMNLEAGDSMILKIRDRSIELEKMALSYMEQAEDMTPPSAENPGRISDND